MKTKLKLAALALLLSTLNLQLLTCFGQGSLTPPGAPAPTMKSLAQIEPRTPVSAAPFTISNSGSYYLTTNLTVSSGDALTIAANNVTLDLNGFTISSTGSSPLGAAILLSGGQTNVAVYNGNLSSRVTNSAAGVFGGGGFRWGIYAGNCYNLRIKDVSVTGVLYSGIFLDIGNATIVESCTINVAGDYGIYAENVSDSTAVNCGAVGIVAGTAHNCKGYGVGSGAGLTATIANNCFGQSSANNTGLSARTANNCYGSSSSGIGLDVGGGVAIGCYGFSTSGSGITAKIANSCVVGSGTTNITYKYNMP